MATQVEIAASTATATAAPSSSSSSSSSSCAAVAAGSGRRVLVLGCKEPAQVLLRAACQLLHLHQRTTSFELELIALSHGIVINIGGGSSSAVTIAMSVSAPVAVANKMACWIPHHDAPVEGVEAQNTIVPALSALAAHVVRVQAAELEHGGRFCWFCRY